jgi:hypothetical protein
MPSVPQPYVGGKIRRKRRAGNLVPQPYVGGRVKKGGATAEDLQRFIKQAKDMAPYAKAAYNFGVNTLGPLSKKAYNWYKSRKNSKTPSKEVCAKCVAVHQEPGSDKVTPAKDMNQFAVAENMKSNPTTDGKGTTCNGGKCGAGNTRGRKKLPTKIRSIKMPAAGSVMMRGPIA